MSATPDPAEVEGSDAAADREPAAMRLAHVVIDVDDLEAAADFYVEALGAVVEPIPAESRAIYRRLALPGQATRLLLHRTDDPPDDGAARRRVHLDLVAPDVDAAVARL